MIDLRISVIGLRQLEAKMLSKITQTSVGIQRALTDIGLLVQREAVKNAPYREGDLEESINFKVGRGWVDIGVGINTRAGKYARRMHEDIYNPGPGTRSKGSRAGRKYIERAIDENQEKIRDLLKLRTFAVT